MSASVLSIGAAYLDINCTDFPFVDALWPEHEVVGTDYEIGPGGSAVNFARASAALGLSATFVGRVGDDVPGRVIEATLEQAKVIPQLFRTEGANTNLGINFNGLDRSTILTAVGSANQALTIDDVNTAVDSFARRADFVYFGGCFKLTMLLPHLADVARRLRARGTKVVVDHGRVVNTTTLDDMAHVRALVANADLYFPSRGEFLRVWGGESVEEAAEAAAGTSGAIIAMKDGAGGACIIESGNVVQVPPYSVSVLGTVGAGDTFNAGFVRARVAGMPVEACADYACASAALKISRPELPTHDGVEALRGNRVK